MCTQYNWWRTLNIILFNFNYKLYSFKNFPVLIVLNDMTRQICHINGHLFLRKYKSLMFHSFKGLYTWAHGFNFMLPSNLLVLPQSDSMKVWFFPFKVRNSKNMSKRELTCHLMCDANKSKTGFLFRLLLERQRKRNKLYDFIATKIANVLLMFQKHTKYGLYYLTNRHSRQEL